jgi:hypothetical protein
MSKLFSITLIGWSATPDVTNVHVSLRKFLQLGIGVFYCGPLRRKKHIALVTGGWGLQII